MKNTHIITYILFSWIVLASFFLFYMQHVDGVFMRKPLTFHMNPMEVSTDKAVYRRGDMISLRFSLCRNRDYTAESTWKLVNETVITFPAQGTKVLTNGCFTDKYFPIGRVPEFAVNGTHHLEGASVVTLNPLHQLFFKYKSVDFVVE